MGKVIGSIVDAKGNFKFIHENTSNDLTQIKEVFQKLSSEMLTRLDDVSRSLPEDHENIESLLDDIQFYIDTLNDGETYLDYGKRFINSEIKKHDKILKEYRI